MSVQFCITARDKHTLLSTNFEASTHAVTTKIRSVDAAGAHSSERKALGRGLAVRQSSRETGGVPTGVLVVPVLHTRSQLGTVLRRCDTIVPWRSN